jgi:hypothetical protein
MGIFKTTQKDELGKTLVVTEKTDIFEEIMKSGETVTLFCMTYFYNGKIEAVNGEDIVLTGARIVYETGSFDTNTFTNAQELCTQQWFVRKQAIESYGILNKK